MSNPLDVPLQFQQQTFWCWAAVAKGVADFFARGDSGFAQCDIATEVLSVGDCCNGAACNSWSELEVPLEVVKHANPPPIDCTGSSDGIFGTIQNEIDGQRPVAARIQWNDGTGHFVVIAGYTLNGQINPTLQILDPWDGSIPMGAAPAITVVPMDIFLTNYQGHGKCTNLYRTT
jgi:hypothetical protein